MIEWPLSTLAAAHTRGVESPWNICLGVGSFCAWRCMAGGTRKQAVLIKDMPFVGGNGPGNYVGVIRTTRDPQPLQRHLEPCAFVATISANIGKRFTQRILRTHAQHVRKKQTMQQCAKHFVHNICRHIMCAMFFFKKETFATEFATTVKKRTFVCAFLKINPTLRMF